MHSRIAGMGWRDEVLENHMVVGDYYPEPQAIPDEWKIECDICGREFWEYALGGTIRGSAYGGHRCEDCVTFCEVCGEEEVDCEGEFCEHCSLWAMGVGK